MASLWCSHVCSVTSAVRSKLVTKWLREASARVAWVKEGATEWVFFIVGAKATDFTVVTGRRSSHAVNITDVTTSLLCQVEVFYVKEG